MALTAGIRLGSYEILGSINAGLMGELCKARATRLEDDRLWTDEPMDYEREKGRRMSKQILKISRAAMESLIRYPWPANVRELQNVIERSVILTSGDVLQVPHLRSVPPFRTAPVTLEEVERDHILKALEESNWVIGGKIGAAARLGVKRTTLIDKMRRRGLLREKGTSIERH